MGAVIECDGVRKVYDGGFEALKGIDLRIERGEIFALLGPNGAGKTTLIGTICGLVRPSAGEIRVAGHDVRREYRAARMKIGLVPQELATDAFETVGATVSFSRGLFGRAKDPAYLEKTLRDLSLWDKRDSKIMQLSGGMKRRVLIAKALAHEPEVLFLDEPTAGVDVELRRDMWSLVRSLRERGVTIVLTTHYIEEAEEMADRVGVIFGGELILTEGKETLMESLGEKKLILTLVEPLPVLPEQLSDLPLAVGDEGKTLTFRFDSRAEEAGIEPLFQRLREANVRIQDVASKESSLEDIFVSLLEERRRQSEDQS
ncbi:MAG: ABC transporter ATP-binding protein [Myxococcota bacterium]